MQKLVLCGPLEKEVGSAMEFETIKYVVSRAYPSKNIGLAAFAAGKPLPNHHFLRPEAPKPRKNYVLPYRFAIFKKLPQTTKITIN